MEEKKMIIPTRMHGINVRCRQNQIEMFSIKWGTIRRIEFTPEFNFNFVEQAIQYLENRNFHVISIAEYKNGTAMLLTDCFDKF